MAIADFDTAVRALADVEAFGLVFRRDQTFVDLLTRHRAGVAAHRLPVARLPHALQPSSVPGLIIIPLTTIVDAGDVFVDRLRQYGIDQLLAVQLRDATGVFWAGKAGHWTVTPDEAPAFTALAEAVAAAGRAEESPRELVHRLSRLAKADALLPVMGSALDVRAVFPKLSAVAKSALHHDVATIQILDDDHEHARLYALDGASAVGIPEKFATNYSALFNEHFLFSIHDDVMASAIERDRPAARAGMRSALRVPIWLEGRVGGALELSSASLAAYRESDVPIARRIADYVSVAISHFRLAEQASRATALMERAGILRTLDELLPTLSGVLDVREVFERVSQIAAKFIPHDGLGLPLLTDDRQHIIPFATAGTTHNAFPAAQPLADGARYLFDTPWEFEVFDDASAAHEIGSTPYTALGYRSMMRVPIRLEGRVAGALVFLSRTARTYTPAAVALARRIAGHLSVVLSHQRIAETARRHEELRARRARLELLDEVLATVAEEGSLTEVFGRFSAMAQRVLAHDALLLVTVNPDGRTARVYASQAPEAKKFPEQDTMPPTMLANRDWEHDLIDDLQARDDQRNLAAGRLGYRSALRAAIRLDGEIVAAVSFLSFTPGRYATADIVVARRIADRIALNFANERRAAATRRADEATARVSRLESRVRDLTEELDSRTGYRRVLGESPQWRAVIKQATQVASTDTTVLLLGESGTGKEVVARFIHRASTKHDGPFVALNCAALPEQLLEAELFGYERGAFTGATLSKPGQLEQASGGSLFLDEVGEMRPSSQAKFLRVLQEREFQRLGGTRVLKTNARIVAATNRDLRRAIADGAFREDLFYRLNVFAIALPPLRDRREDVLPLSQAFLVEFGRSLGRPPSGISRDARQLLLDYHWPGNVRELRNMLERAAILCDGGLITADHLSLSVQKPAGGAQPSSPGPAAPAGDLGSMERGMIEKALQKHRFNKSKAAAELGLTRAQLYVRLKRHGLD
ncbi:MAG: sigma 54-interacting transcriptional regulator [Vicinamibacterales bacterium]